MGLIGQSIAGTEAIYEYRQGLLAMTDTPILDGQEAETGAVIEKLLKHMLRHSDDSVRRSERTLLLANCGALALLLNAPGPDYVPRDLLWPCMLFTFGIFCAGAWSVIDGFTMLGMRKLLGSSSFREPLIKTTKNIIESKIGARVDWQAIDIDGHFPPERIQRGMSAGFWFLLLSGISLVVGVIWSFIIIFF